MVDPMPKPLEKAAMAVGVTAGGQPVKSLVAKRLSAETRFPPQFASFNYAIGQ